MNLKDELLNLFPIIEISYSNMIGFIVRNNRKYKGSIFYKISIKCEKGTHFL